MNATIEEINEKMDARMEKMDEKIGKQKDNIITSLSEKFQMEVEANKNETPMDRRELSRTDGNDR